MAYIRSGKSRGAAFFSKGFHTRSLVGQRHGKQNILMVGEHTGVVGVGFCS